MLHTKGEWIVNRISMNEDAFEILTSTPLAAEMYGAIAKIEISKYNNKVQAEANAAFICKAVNNHDALLNALKEIMQWGKIKDGKFTFTTSEKQAKEFQTAIKNAEL